ncbi:unnamed protein product [Amaranthus hypochondriacus]
MPFFEDRIHRPPPGYVGVYTRQVQFGLRFPLHPFVTQLLNGYIISLCQLTAASIRRVMTFLWVALFYAFDPNSHVFRKLHNLLLGNQSDNRHGLGWWRIEAQKWFLASWPNDSSDEDWRGQWIWVRAPSKEGTGRQGREQNAPATWLPCYHFIFQEKILAAVGLKRKYRDVEPEEYFKQKPWYLKRDPYFPLGSEEEIAAAAGDSVVRTDIFTVNSKAGNEIGDENL